MVPPPDEGGGGPSPPSEPPPPGVSKAQQRRNDSLDDVVKRNVRGDFTGPREQFVFANEVLSDEALAKIWNISVEKLAHFKARDAARGLDWAKLRDQHWKQVMLRVGEVVEEQTTEDLQNSFANWRAITGWIALQLQSKDLVDVLRKNRKSNPKTFMNLLGQMARVTKTCVDIDEKLTGAKAAQQRFDAQMDDYNWFVETIKAYVREPQALEHIGKAIQARRITRTLIATEDYADAIAYARKPSFQAAVEEARQLEPAAGIEVQDVDQTGDEQDFEDEPDVLDDDPDGDVEIGD